MIAPPGTTLWFVQHEWRLAWRDWLAMMSGGRRKSLRRAVIAIAIFVLFMHFVALSRLAASPLMRPPTKRHWLRSPAVYCCRGC